MMDTDMYDYRSSSTGHKGATLAWMMALRNTRLLDFRTKLRSGANGETGKQLQKGVVRDMSQKLINRAGKLQSNTSLSMVSPHRSWIDEHLHSKSCEGEAIGNAGQGLKTGLPCDSWQ